MGPLGERDMKSLSGPGKLFEKGKFVTVIILPLQKKASSDAYLRFIPRTEMDIAVVGAGVRLRLDPMALLGGKVISRSDISDSVTG